MKKILLLGLLSNGVLAADKILWAPSGDWKILTTTSQKVNLNDTLYTTQDGKVGIGVQAPSLKLEVSGTVKATAAQIDTISNTAGTGAVTFSQGLTVTSGKVLKADSIQTTSGSPPPGFVPIGGMIAVMPTTAGTWQPPTTGAIKDGFMRADGGSVPTCADCSIPQGTVLPDMRQRYAKGSNVGTSGTTGGSNLYTPAGTNAASNVPASGLTFSGTSGTYSVSVPGHYHGFSLTASTGVNLTHNHGFRTNWSPANTFIDNYYMATADVENRYLGSTTYSNTNTVIISDSGTLDHSHSVSGSVGLVSGSNGNTSFSASGSNTPAGSIAGTATAAAQVFTGTQGNNEPAYVEVVWVIRVK